MGYVLPTTLHPTATGEGAEEAFVLKFRVAKPFQNVAIEIKQDGQLVKRIKKPYLLPAEMENIKLSASELLAPAGTISVEVAE